MESITKLFALAGVSGVLIAGSLTTSAFAWQPEGTVKKYVQNQTGGGEMADANDAGSAVSAKPGDLLKYTVVVENKGKEHDKGENDMAKTVLTDTLPAGMELIINPAQRTITEDLGALKPGQKVTKEYVVKVTSEKDGETLDNKACFTGNSTNDEAPQNGCDNAVIKVSNPSKEEPTKQEPPKEPPTKQEVKGETTAAAAPLATTGPANILLPVSIATGLGYAGNLLRLKRRASQTR